MKTSKMVLAAFLAAVALMSGCANQGPRPVQSQAAYPDVAYGVIDSIETTRVANDQIGAGAVIGGIVGGVLGHQVGGGTGRDVATVAGVAGGAVAGHQIQKHSSQREAYRIRVRLERGGYVTVTQDVSDLRVGDRVRIVNDVVSRDR